MKILTAYFSHAGENYFDGKIKAISEGNTAIVAKKIAAATGSDVFEIARETPYPYSYAECVKEAKEEFIRNSRPELKEKISVKGYDVVILAYPNVRHYADGGIHLPRERRFRGKEDTSPMHQRRQSHGA